MSHSVHKSEAFFKPKRIVPAIPLPYTRVSQQRKADETKQPQRTLTPDRSDKSTDSPRHNGIQPDGLESHSTCSIEEPMTPDSLSSAIAKEPDHGGEEGTDMDRQDQDGAGNIRVANGTSNDTEVSTRPDFQPDQVHTNGDYELKHENALNGEQSVEKQHSRSQSLDLSPLESSSRNPPQHETRTSITSTEPFTTQQVNYKNQVNFLENVHHNTPMVNVMFDSQTDSSNPSPAEAASARSGMYPLPPQAYLSGSFPPGLPHPPGPRGFNPQASVFQSGSQVPTRSHSPSSHDLRFPVRFIQHANAGSMAISDTSSNAMNTQAAMTLKSYFEFQFGSPEFSDVTVKILGSDQQADPITISAHRIVLARSSKFRELVESDTNVVHIKLEAKYLETNTFIHVLRYLYGAALPSRTSFSGQPMDQSLALAAAGWYCKLPEVTVQGLDYASSWLGWETIHRALSFALEGGLTTFFQFDDRDVTSEPMFGEYAGRFLQFILDWLATNITSDFEFIASAPQLLDSPRLPGTLENRPSMANPRLSRIRFGDLPSEESNHSSTLLSSIMLSVPLGPLRYLLLHPVFQSRPHHVEMVRAVIKEREDRRIKALESKRLLPGATAEMLKAMYWKESVVPATGHHSQGFTLGREWLNEGYN